MKPLLYATSNPGKLDEVRGIFAHHQLDVLGPADLGISLQIEETGATLEENARLKAEAYLPYLPAGAVIIGDDTGLEIDALGGEPGIRVRRWKGYEMTDEEIISHCLSRMQDVPAGKRQARFHTVFAVASPGIPVKFFHGIFAGEILAEPRKERVRGMPLFPLFYIPELQKTLGEFHQMPVEKQLEYPTHREKAAISSLPYIRTLLNKTV